MTIDVHALLAERRQITIVWDIADVKEVRPDLDDEQCWQVLRQVERWHDASIGISWDILSGMAAWLYPTPEG